MATYLEVPVEALITRDTYDKAKNYASVIYQKGKPVLDAELNESQKIVYEKMEFLAKV